MKRYYKTMNIISFLLFLTSIPFTTITFSSAFFSVQYYVKFSFMVTYVLLMTTATITFIEAIRTPIPVKHTTSGLLTAGAGLSVTGTVTLPTASIADSALKNIKYTLKQVNANTAQGIQEDKVPNIMTGGASNSTFN